MLITKEIAKKLPALYANDNKEAKDIKVPLKLFGGACTWYITEMDPESGTMFGLCDLGMGFPELGYVSLNELKSVRFPPLGLPVERDMWWNTNITLDKVMDKVMNGDRI